MTKTLIRISLSCIERSSFGRACRHMYPQSLSKAQNSVRLAGGMEITQGDCTCPAEAGSLSAVSISMLLHVASCLEITLAAER